MSWEFPHLLHSYLLSASAHVENINVEDGEQGSSYGPMIRFVSLARPSSRVGEPLLLELEQRWGSVGYGRLGATASFTLGKPHGVQVAPVIDVRIVSHDAPIECAARTRRCPRGSRTPLGRVARRRPLRRRSCCGCSHRLRFPASACCFRRYR